MRILVIEDDPNTMALVALYLEREGFRPITAADGRTHEVPMKPAASSRWNSMRVFGPTVSVWLSVTGQVSSAGSATTSSSCGRT